LDLPRNIPWLVRIFLPVEIAQTETKPTLGISPPWGWRIVLSFGIGLAWQCSELEDSPGEQVCFALAQEHWPVEHFGQPGQRSVLQPLQYSTGTEVVR